MCQKSLHETYRIIISWGNLREAPSSCQLLHRLKVKMKAFNVFPIRKFRWAYQNFFYLSLYCFIIHIILWHNSGPGPPWVMSSAGVYLLKLFEETCYPEILTRRLRRHDEGKKNDRRVVTLQLLYSLRKYFRVLNWKSPLRYNTYGWIKKKTI